MTVTFKDYYEILGVPRTASRDEIKRAYRKKARKLHPDVDASPGAQERFQELNEAHEVLSDPDKRQRFDQLGANWRHGAPFEPPPGFTMHEFHVGDLGGLDDLFGGGRGGPSGFSEFFETLFGGLGGFGPAAGTTSRRASPRGRDVSAEMELTLADLVHPRPRRITLGVPGADGRVETKTVTVNIPPGVRPGQRLRLPGLAGPASGAAPAGDIYLALRLAPSPGLSIEGDDLVAEAEVPAPVAVVGGEIRVEAADGTLTLRVAPGTQAGGTLRVRGRGLPRKDGSRGDLRVKVKISVPKRPNAEQRELYEKLAGLEGRATRKK